MEPQQRKEGTAINKPDDQIVDFLRSARRDDPPWAPIGRGGHVVQMPKVQRVYDGFTLATMFALGFIIGAMVLLMVSR